MANTLYPPFDMKGYISGLRYGAAAFVHFQAVPFPKARISIPFTMTAEMLSGVSALSDGYCQ